LHSNKFKDVSYGCCPYDTSLLIDWGEINELY